MHQYFNKTSQKTFYFLSASITILRLVPLLLLVIYFTQLMRPVKVETRVLGYCLFWLFETLLPDTIKSGDLVYLTQTKLTAVS